MKAAERMGLIGAGSVSRFIAAHMRSLHARLGPVKGVSFSSARRAVMTLRAGFAVPNYSALEWCPAIWICVPDVQLDAVVRDVAIEIPPHKAMAVVCDSVRESTSFELLRARGMRVATLNCIGADPSPDPKRGCVAEGHRETLRLLQRMFAEDKRSLLLLKTGTKAGYLAGVHMVTELLRPWVASAIALMQQAGIGRPEAVEIAESLALRTLRSQSKVGHKRFSSAIEAELQGALSRSIAGLSGYPRDAGLYASGLRLALDYFQSSGGHGRVARHHA